MKNQIEFVPRGWRNVEIAPTLTIFFSTLAHVNSHYVGELQLERSLPNPKYGGFWKKKNHQENCPHLVNT